MLAAERDRPHWLQRPRSRRAAGEVQRLVRVCVVQLGARVQHRSVAGQPQHAGGWQLGLPYHAQSDTQDRHQDRHGSGSHRRVGERRGHLQRQRRAQLQQQERVAPERHHGGGAQLRRLRRSPVAQRRVPQPPERGMHLRRDASAAFVDRGLRLRRLSDLRPVWLRQRRRHRRDPHDAQQLPQAQHHHAHHAAKRHRAHLGQLWSRGQQHLSTGLLRGGLRVRAGLRRAGCVQRPHLHHARISTGHLRVLRHHRRQRRAGLSLHDRSRLLRRGGHPEHHQRQDHACQRCGELQHLRSGRVGRNRSG